MTKISKWKVPPTGGSSAPQQPCALGGWLMLAPLTCAAPCQTPSLMSLTTLKSRRWADGMKRSSI